MNNNIFSLLVFPRWCKYIFTCIPYYYYSAKRFIRNTKYKTSEEAKIGVLTMDFHSIEKGFCMPDFRYGFGQRILNTNLIQFIEYLDKYGTENIQARHIAETLYEYLYCHEANNFQLDANIEKQIREIISRFPDLSKPESIQIGMTREEYFSASDKDFPTFAQSRHSCRNFTEEPVDIKLLEKAVHLAQTSPSACNRQPARVYIIDSKDKIVKSWKIMEGIEVLVRLSTN